MTGLGIFLVGETGKLDSLPTTATDKYLFRFVCQSPSYGGGVARIRREYCLSRCSSMGVNPALTSKLAFCVGQGLGVPSVFSVEADLEAL